MRDDVRVLPRKVAFAIAAAAWMTAITLADDASPPVRWIEGSTVPLLQLPGEKFQYYTNGCYFKDNTSPQRSASSGD